MADHYGTSSKKIMFYDTDKRHADLKIRLQHDSMTQSDFFRIMVTGYLDKDPRIMEYIEEFKSTSGVQSKADRSKTSKMIRAGNEMEAAHGLKDSEINSIFDLIEQEHPEL